jgi:hypothetical protein
LLFLAHENNSACNKSDNDQGPGGDADNRECTERGRQSDNPRAILSEGRVGESVRADAKTDLVFRGVEHGVELRDEGLTDDDVVIFTQVVEVPVAAWVPGSIGEIACVESKDRVRVELEGDVPVRGELGAVEIGHVRLAAEGNVANQG